MFAVPDLTIPDAASHRALPPATVVRAVAADLGSWQHLVHYAPSGPSRCSPTRGSRSPAAA